MIFNPHERPKAKKWDGRELSLKRIEVKNDGYRATFLKGKDANVKLLGRNLVDYLPRMLDEDRESMISRFAKVPPNTVIDGELYLSGRPASEISNGFKEGGDFIYQPFAVPVYFGKNKRRISFQERDELLDSMDWSPPISYSQKEPSISGREHLEFLKKEAATIGIEGWILKELHWGNWWKVKPTKSVDAFVVDTKPGTGKHKGRLGALEVAVHSLDPTQPAIRIASVGKGNDDQWRNLSHDEVIGRVCEVDYEEVQARGRLKFSNFLRWREDKPLTECSIEQLK